MIETRKVLFIIVSLIAVYAYGCRDTSTSSFEEAVPEVYTITTSSSPEEGGDVIPSTDEFPEGSRIEVEALPSQGWVFAGWEGDLQGSINPDSLTVDGDKKITALFVRSDFELNIEVIGEGRVRTEELESKLREMASPIVAEASNVHVKEELSQKLQDQLSGDLNIPKSKPRPVQDNNSETGHTTANLVRTVELTAEPFEGWEFARWEGDLQGNENPATIVVDEDKNVTAVFEQEGTTGYSLTVQTQGQGTVGVAPDQEQYEEGDEVTLTANPAGDWTFLQWQGDLSGTDNPITIVMDEDKSVTAVFEAPAGSPTMAIVQQPTQTIAGNAIAPAPFVEVTDPQDNPVEGVEVTVALNTNDFASGSTTTITTNTSGAATFDNLVINTAGTGYILTFSADVVSSETSNSFNIIAAEGDPVQTTASVPNGAAGEPTNIGITVEDAFGNRVPDAAGDLSLSVTSGPNSGATFSGITHDGNGVYSTSYTPISNGDDEITIQLNGNEISGSPFTSNVSTSDADAVTMVTQPNQTTAGQPIAGPPSVLVTDSQTNPVEGVEVTASEQGGYGFDGGTLTATTGSDGIVTFNDLVINTAGSYTLVFDAVGVSSDAVSNEFDVTAAGVDQMTPVSGDNQTGQIGTALDNPFVVRLEDAFGNPVAGHTVNFVITGEPGGATGQSLSPSSPTTGADGQAASTLTLGDASGTYTVEATAAGVSPVSFSATAEGGDPESMSINQQPTATTAGEAIDPAPAVTVEDTFGDPVEGVEVTISLNGGSFAGGSTTSATTNTSGVASFGNLVINTAATDYSLTFSTTGVSNVISASFNVDATSPDQMLLISGNNQTGQIGTALTEPFVVRVEDTFGNRVAGHSVNFAIDTFPIGASGQSLSTTSATTGADGQASSTLTLGDESGTYMIEATAADVNPVSFSATAEGGDPENMTVTQDPSQTVAGNAISPAPAVTVLDQFDEPVEGVEVTVDLNGGSFASGTTTANTNASGVASFSNLVINTAATGYTLTFSTSGVSNVTSGSFNVTAAAGDPNQTTATVPNGTAGEPTDIAITVEDQFGNPITGLTGANISVNVTSGPNSGAEFSSISDEGGGNYSTSYTPTTIGIDEITILLNSTEISDSPFESTVSSGSVSTVNINQQPANTTAGEAISPAPSVTVVDTFGNSVAGMNVTVALNNNDFAVGSTTNATTNGNGVATFSNLIIEIATTGYTLTFSAGGVSSPSSNTFAITAAEGDPSSTTADVPETINLNLLPSSIEITIFVRDQFGNPVTGVAADLFVDVSSGPNAEEEVESISDDGNGVYSTSYSTGLLQVEDTDVITIELDGEPINGSPYEVDFELL